MPVGGAFQSLVAKDFIVLVNVIVVYILVAATQLGVPGKLLHRQGGNSVGEEFRDEEVA